MNENEKVIDDIETIVINQIQFCNITLAEMRMRNKDLQEKLGMSFAKFIGVSTIFEEAICSLRKTTTELGKFLMIIRRRQP
jgi:hypothetical protein